jgi:Fic family protein
MVGARSGTPRGFVPQAVAGQGRLPTGQAQAALALWLRGATRATQAALLHLDQVAAWARRASLALTDLQGRTPPALLAVLVEWPMVTTGLAERLTGASKASVLRNLDRMQARGLLREVTGQGRYRVWTAKL